MLRHLFSDPYVCTIVITHAIYSINIAYTQQKKQTKKKKDHRSLSFKFQRELSIKKTIIYYFYRQAYKRN